MKSLGNRDVCFVCRRRADGLGVGSERRIGWMCQHCADGGYGMKAYAMTNRQFDEYEGRALVAAGQMAGAYLDAIGRTDLAALTPKEWTEFCRTMVLGFGDSIRREVGRGIVRDGFGEAIYGQLSTEEIQSQEEAA